MFRTIEGKEVDVLKHIGEMIDPVKEYELIIGSDSQQVGPETKYATVIVLWEVGHGAHIIYEKVIVKRVKDLFMRLWKEVELTADVAKILIPLAEKFNIKMSLHLDINTDKRHKSNIVLQAAFGYLKGMNYENIYFKPEAAIASIIADKYCK